MVTALTSWAVLIGAAILASLVMWAAVEKGRRGLEVIRKRFFCFGKEREVEVDFLARMGRPEILLGVKSCSAFKEGEEINCDKSCLHLPHAQAAPPLFHRPLSPTVARGNGLLV